MDFALELPPTKEGGRGFIPFKCRFFDDQGDCIEIRSLFFKLSWTRLREYQSAGIGGSSRHEKSVWSIGLSSGMPVNVEGLLYCQATYRNHLYKKGCRIPVSSNIHETRLTLEWGHIKTIFALYEAEVRKHIFAAALVCYQHLKMLTFYPATMVPP